MGVLADPADAPDGSLEYTDGVQLAADPASLPADYESFPYLATPIAGSPNE